MVLFLDAQNRIVATEEMFSGTLTQTSVYPREVVKHALQHNAASVIFCAQSLFGGCRAKSGRCITDVAVKTSVGSGGCARTRSFYCGR
jgi:hypothetical protein